MKIMVRNLLISLMLVTPSYLGAMDVDWEAIGKAHGGVSGVGFLCDDTPEIRHFLNELNCMAHRYADGAAMDEATDRQFVLRLQEFQKAIPQESQARFSEYLMSIWSVRLNGAFAVACGYYENNFDTITPAMGVYLKNRLLKLSEDIAQLPDGEQAMVRLHLNQVAMVRFNEEVKYTVNWFDKNRHPSREALALIKGKIATMSTDIEGFYRYLEVLPDPTFLPDMSGRATYGFWLGDLRSWREILHRLSGDPYREISELLRLVDKRFNCGLCYVTGGGSR